MERSEDTSIKDKAKLALNAILQNIQVLKMSFARKVLNAFRDVAGEQGELGFDAATKVLRSLELAAFVDGGSDAGLPLGNGEEWRRLWRLWKSEADTVDEQLFLFLAWRGHRYCDHSFVKDIAHELFMALDLDGDAGVSWADLQTLFRQGDTGAWASSEEAERNIDLMQLLDYHAIKDEAEGSKDPQRSIGFPSFLAWICDAQDTAAIRRAASGRPMECVLRFDRWVPFMRPQDLGACVDPKEEEDFDAVLGESPQELALKAAKAALQEARHAKQLADAAQQAVTELVRSQPGTPSAQEEKPSFGMAPPKAPAAPAATSSTAAPTETPVTPRRPLVQSMIEEAPIADTVMPMATRPPVAAPVAARTEPKEPKEPKVEAKQAATNEVKSLPLGTANLTEGLIEEAPIEETSPRSPRSKLEKKKSFRPTKKIHISVTDVKCRGCGEVVKSDSNYCRHCGVPIKGRQSVTSLRVEKASLPNEEEKRPRLPPNPRYCALDADTESLPKAETPANLRNQSQEEEWEETTCGACHSHFLPGANFCSNCGRKRERFCGTASLAGATPRTPMTPLTRSTESTGTPTQSPKSQDTSSVRLKPTVTKDGSTGYAAPEVTPSRVAVAPRSSPSWTKISADGDGGTPTATVGLDMTGSGTPNLYIKGEDLNRDGIPDVLLSEGTTLLVQNGQAVSVKSDVSTLQKPTGSQVIKTAASPVKAQAAATPAAAAPVVAAAVAAGAAGSSRAMEQMEAEEEEWYDEDEEGEEEEDFEDDPVVDPAPKDQAKAGTSKR